MFILCGIWAILSVGSVLGVTLKKGRYEDFAPVTLFSIIIFLYFFAFVDMLKYGVYILLAIIIAIYVFCIIRLKQKKWKIREFCGSFFTPASVIFFILCVISVSGVIGMRNNAWDEFTHWADVVKAMVSTNFLSTNAANESAFQSYPPAMSLWQYFVQKIQMLFHNEDAFIEWYLHFLYQIATYVVFLPLLRKIKFNNVFNLFICFLLIFLLPSVFFETFWKTVYIDPFVGLLGGAIFAYLLCDLESKSLKIFLVLEATFCVVLSKDAGIIYAIFAVVYIVGYAIMHKDKIGFKITNSWMFAILVGGATVLAKLSWKAKISLDHAGVKFDTPKVNFAELREIVTGNATENYRYTVYVNYKERFFDKSIRVLGGNFNFSCWQLYILLIVAFLIVLFLLCRRKHEKTKEYGLMIGILTIESLVYIISMCIIYQYNFNTYEAIGLASYSRYMCINFAMLFVVLVLGIIWVLNETEIKLLNEKVAFWLAWSLSVVAFFPTEMVDNYISGSNVKESRSRIAYEEYIESCKAKMEKKVNNVYVIAQGDDGFIFWICKYYLRPNYVLSTGSSKSFISNTNNVSETGKWSINVTPEEWMQTLTENYDYVIVYAVDDYFVQNFGKLFEKTEDLTKVPQLYKVNKNRKMLELVE